MRRPRWVGVLALLLALGCAIGTGLYTYNRRTPAPTQHMLTSGQTVEVHGVRYRLDSFTVAESLPAEDPQDPPVRGPAGSMMCSLSSARPSSTGPSGSTNTSAT